MDKITKFSDAVDKMSQMKGMKKVSNAPTVVYKVIITLSFVSPHNS